MDKIDQEVIKGVLLSVVSTLHMIELEDIEEYVKDIQNNNAMYDTLGPILDPTEYRSTLHSGRRSNVKTELEIAQKLLEIRRLIDQITPVSGR